MNAPSPARPPQRVVLDGHYTRLEPIGPQHVADMYSAAAGEEQRFAYLFEGPPASEDAMAEWIARAAPKDDPLYFAVIDKTTGRAEGRQSLMRITPEHGVIEIGGIYWGPAISRTRVTTESSSTFPAEGLRRSPRPPHFRRRQARSPSMRAPNRVGG